MGLFNSCDVLLEFRCSYLVMFGPTDSEMFLLEPADSSNIRHTWTVINDFWSKIANLIMG